MGIRRTCRLRGAPVGGGANLQHSSFRPGAFADQYICLNGQVQLVSESAAFPVVAHLLTGSCYHVLLLANNQTADNECHLAAYGSQPSASHSESLAYPNSAPKHL